MDDTLDDATLHIDGGARGNPGPAAGGVVLADARTGSPVAEAGYFFGKTTNNVAEYLALIRGIKLAIEHKVASLAIYSDSQLVVRQVMGEYRVKSPDLKPLFTEVRSLLNKIDQWSITHIPRAENARADELANLAMDAGKDVSPPPGRSETAQQGNNSQASPVDAIPAFTATIAGKGRSCHMGQSAGNEYTFGRTIPEGFCVYAAQAALCEGPLDWPKNKRSGQARCGRCGATVKLDRIT